MATLSTEDIVAKQQEQQRELDITINQRLNVQFTDRATNAGDHARRSIVAMTSDISSFARFLTEQRCLEVLLFWKEVEQFKGLFDTTEKAALFTKIYELYCEPGALWQVNFRGEFFKDIQAASKEGMKGNVEDEVFDAAQNEVYELMRLELFPRFQEQLEALSLLDGEDEKRAQSVSDVTSGTNPAATRSFMRFAREQHCEEALLFWLEANDYALLFQPMDQLTKSQAIYESYLGPKAKTKVNVSDRTIADIGKAIADKSVTNALFVGAQTEIISFVEQDLFGRYEEWYAEQQQAKSARAQNKAASDSTLLDPARLGDRERMREALVALIGIPDHLVKLRESARKLDAEEALDFYIDAKKYQLLFVEKDRVETAARLWDRYLDVKSDRRITIPDDIYSDLEKKITKDHSGAASLFDVAIKDVLNLMTDNVYPAHVKAQDASKKAAAPTASVTSKPQPSGGGCCLVM